MCCVGRWVLWVHQGTGAASRRPGVSWRISPTMFLLALQALYSKRELREGESNITDGEGEALTLTEPVCLKIDDHHADLFYWSLVIINRQGRVNYVQVNLHGFYCHHLRGFWLVFFNQEKHYSYQCHFGLHRNQSNNPMPVYLEYCLPQVVEYKSSKNSPQGGWMQISQSKT